VSSVSGRETARGLFAATVGDVSTPYWIIVFPLQAIGFGIGVAVFGASVSANRTLLSVLTAILPPCC
jgi:hypothetical protein